MKSVILKFIKRTLQIGLLAAIVFLVNLIWFKPFFINHFYDRIFVEFALKNPQMITSMGHKFFYDELNDNSQEANDEQLELLKTDYEMLHEYNRDKLQGQPLLSYDILDWFLQGQIDGIKYKNYGYSQTQKNGLYMGIINFMTNMHRIDDVGDAEDYISRISQVGRVFDNELIQVKKEQQNGVIPPDFIIRKTLENMHNLRDPKPESNELTKDFMAKISKIKDMDAETKSDLESRFYTELNDVVLPAYDRMIAFYEELLTHADSRAGVWKFPNGDDYYQYQIKANTTTDYSPEYLHNLGVSEVDRIVAEIKSILSDQGYDTENATVGELLNNMSQDSGFLYEDSEAGRKAIIADYQKIIDEIDAQMGQSFGILPAGKVEVRKVPEYKEKTAAGGYYERPSMDGSRPGRFYANLYDITATPKFAMRTLAYHEAVPGHHFQLAIQNELKDLPMFRGFMGFSGFTEGWALYAERLAYELGFQKDPFDNVGRLQAELLRAVRLVVDTGIHYKKWTREQAIDYMFNTTGLAMTDVESEIERYIVWPGQALAYKVGMIKILELRDKAKEKLKQRFDLKEFHDVVLKNGAIPLNLLEREVDEYIRKRSA